jgi:hypothetical protein
VLKITCLPETASVSVDGSGLYTCLTGSSLFDPTLCPGALDMTFTAYGGSLPNAFKLGNLHVFHITAAGAEDVPFCKAGVASISGDCIFSAVQDKHTGNLTVTVQGPTQGRWGGAG